MKRLICAQPVLSGKPASFDASIATSLAQIRLDVSSVGVAEKSSETGNELH